MKKIAFTLIAFVFSICAYAQIKYDNGPITVGDNFVVSGSWG